MSAPAAIGKVVGPGDKVLDIPSQGTLRLSVGLRTHEGNVVSTKGGVLRATRNGQLYLEGRQKRYMPAEGDVVVGVIVDKHSENFTVDVGGPFNAVLPQLSFEGATRRNRPNLHPGDLVYARVVQAHRDTDPVLSCVDAAGRAAGFGHLKDGMVLTCSSSLARQLLGSPTAPVLEALGAGLQFELAVGLNGRVWLTAATAATCVLVSNAIVESEFKTPVQVDGMDEVRRLKKAFESAQSRKAATVLAAAESECWAGPVVEEAMVQDLTEEGVPRTAQNAVARLRIG